MDLVNQLISQNLLDFQSTGTFKPTRSFSPSKKFTLSIHFTMSSPFTDSNDFSLSFAFSPSFNFTNSMADFESTKKVIIPNNIESPQKGKTNISIVAGSAIWCTALVGSIVLAAIFLNRRRKLLNGLDTENEDVTIIDTNSISNVIDNLLCSQMDGVDDPFESDFNDVYKWF